MNKLIQFALAGIVETIKQRRVIKTRERAARHNLYLAEVQRDIRITQDQK